VNSLPKSVTRQRRGCDLNPGSSAPESSMLRTVRSVIKYELPLKQRLFYFIQYIHSCTKYTECPSNDSPIEYNCKISWQKTALTDSLEHTQAVSIADRVQCLTYACE